MRSRPRIWESHSHRFPQAKSPPTAGDFESSLADLSPRPICASNDLFGFVIEGLVCIAVLPLSNGNRRLAQENRRKRARIQAGNCFDRDSQMDDGVRDDYIYDTVLTRDKVQSAYLCDKGFIRGKLERGAVNHGACKG